MVNSWETAYVDNELNPAATLRVEDYTGVDGRKLVANYSPTYFFNPACQFNQSVTGGGAAASPSAGITAKNRWPSAEG
jgi:hypothetical protein